MSLSATVAPSLSLAPRELIAAGQGPIAGQHYLPLDAHQAYWGELPTAGDTPALSIASGESITIDTLSHEGILADQGSDPAAFFAACGVPGDLVLDEARAMAAQPDRRRTGPHVVSPPVQVNGAQPGDLLAITVLDLHRRVPYGVISNRHARGALPGEMPEGGVEAVSVFASVLADASGREFGAIGRRVEHHFEDADPSELACFELAPFLGITGVATAGGQRVNSVPPGAHGGNIDINLLTVGATLYLPVQVPGALAYVGDPHFAQGDGEVALTALEASLRADLRLTVIPRQEASERFGELAGPLAETSEYLIPTGMDADLDVAMANCVRAALALLEAHYGMSRAQAYAYLSAATDFNISQVVDLVKGVHARIRKADFR